jgi:hypothetical protein
LDGGRVTAHTKKCKKVVRKCAETKKIARKKKGDAV